MTAHEKIIQIIVSVAILYLVLIVKNIIVGIFRYNTRLTLGYVAIVSAKKELKARLAMYEYRGGRHSASSYVVDGEQFCCEYNIKENLMPGARNIVYEKVRIFIPGRSGFFNAVFCNEELVAWTIGSSDDIMVMPNAKESFDIKCILGAVQNAVGRAKWDDLY